MGLNLEQARQKAEFDMRWADIEGVEFMGEAPLTTEQFKNGVEKLVGYYLTQDDVKENGNA